jgi:hypothetical protein
VERLANFVQKSVETTLEKLKTDFSKIFQTRNKLDSESTDFLFRFLIFLRIWRILSHSSKKKNPQLSYISKFFTIFFAKLKEIRHKENGGSYPPQSSSNSGIAYPANQRFCFGGNFPKFPP